ncbi:MAG: 4,5-DOPA dioxygenase extradiol [Burkholderiales bacterium]|nr:4,5-DOPA dioxygenase extradiol [Burkholderiales bacterium]
MASATHAAPLQPAPLPRFSELKPSPRMPVIFLGHGSPMNAIEDNASRRSWQQLGRSFAAAGKYPVPQLILCISAHWLTRGWWVTAMTQPKTIHDFGGFPQALFDQQYPAPGAPVAAREIASSIKQPVIGLDDHEWGLDHGAWSVLKPMFPEARIPVVQLSMDYSRPPAEHFALGQQLARLRDVGVLIVGSGNTVHNLRAMQWGAGPDKAYDWAREFDQKLGAQIESGDLAGLANFHSLGQIAALAHPTHDHLLPLLYTAGAVQASSPASPGRGAQFLNADFQGASIAMRSVVWA